MKRYVLLTTLLLIGGCDLSGLSSLASLSDATATACALLNWLLCG